MSKLSITTAWNEAIAFIKREGQLLFPLALLLIALPGVAMQLFMPAQPAPGQMPAIGAWLLLFPLVIVLSMVGNIALAFLALRSGASVGEALGRGARRFLPLLGAGLLVALGGAILLFLIAMLVVLLVPGAADSMAGPQPGPEAQQAIGLIVLILAPIALFFGTRLALMTPIAAGEDAGPLALIGRSWRLTAGNFWRLLGFILLFVILAMVATLAVQFVLGSLLALAFGPPSPGSLGFVLLLLLLAVVNAVFYVFLITTLARIYAQLSRAAPAEAPGRL